MNKRNWPFFTDLGDPNWTGRTTRTMRNQTRYTQADERIPPIAWERKIPQVIRKPRR